MIEYPHDEHGSRFLIRDRDGRVLARGEPCANLEASKGELLKMLRLLWKGVWSQGTSEMGIEQAPATAPAPQHFKPAPEGAIGWTVLGEIDAYCERTGTDHRLFGRRLCGGGGFVGRLRRLGHIREPMVLGARDLIAKHPEGLKDG